MNTFASMFSGFGGAEAGAVAAGLAPIWAIESDPDIAGAHTVNFPECETINRPAQEVDYLRLPVPYWLHVSPPCTNASVANSEAGESELDVILGRATARAIKGVLPSVISLENVWKYREFESFRIICNALDSAGYSFDYWHLNAADYGVAQTRKRLILVASRTFRPVKPVATHRDPKKVRTQVSFFDSPTLPWNGWYQAIEDLIPTLPASQFAPWQLKRLESRGVFDASFLLMAGNTQIECPTGTGVKAQDEPSNTVLSSSSAARAFLVHSTEMRNTPMREQSQPAFTLTISEPRPSHMPKAFIVDGKPANYAGDLRVIDGDAPVATLTATQPQHPFRAFICSSIDCTTRESSEPSTTIVCAGDGHSVPPKAWLEQGRVVSMTPRALARFQSIPDWMMLPDHNGLACRVIGNAVPSLLMQRVIEAQG